MELILWFCHVSNWQQKILIMEIQDIKQRLSILLVLEHYSLKPNRNKMINCPFHDDKNPSMQVYPETNTVFCFSGNCKMNGKAMDTIEFIQ